MWSEGLRPLVGFEIGLRAHEDLGLKVKRVIPGGQADFAGIVGGGQNFLWSGFDERLLSDNTVFEEKLYQLLPGDKFDLGLRAVIEVRISSKNTY